MLAQVEPLESAGAGGRGQGLQDARKALLVGDHGQLVLACDWSVSKILSSDWSVRIILDCDWSLAAREEVGEAHLDVLAGELVEADVLGVDDPRGGLVVPTGVPAELVHHRALVRVVQELETVRIMMDHLDTTLTT